MARLRVLVTNARRRKAVPIVRALGQAGMDVTCADSVRHAAAFFSRHCNHRFLYPDPTSDGFLEAFLERLDENPCDVILPLDDDVLAIVSKHRHRLANPQAVLLPDHETVMLAGDKSRLVPYAASLGVATPRTTVIRCEQDLGGLGEIDMPAVVKPSHGSGSRGLQYVQTHRDLRRLCKEALAAGTTVLVQERLPAEGPGLGYFALYDRDRTLVAEFMHRRLREYPISGGPSTLREGIWDPALARQARGLLESLNWVGLAMVEFKRDPRDGQAKLMEINPRLWGSIALPIFSGVNFPVLAARVAAGQDVDPARDYAVGKRARWLCPGDLLHLISSLRRGHRPRGFFKLSDPDTCYDLLSLTDPLPAPVLLASAAISVCASGLRRLRPGRKGEPAASTKPGPQPCQVATGSQGAKGGALQAAMTIDVEDWFHILDSPVVPTIDTWGALECRLARNMDRLLEMFVQTGTRVTFFWLGWLAERHKGLVRTCLRAGHEIASHGYGHVLAYQVGRPGFRDDIVRAKDILEDITGQAVNGFRAAGFGITDETDWAFDVIRQTGHRYDSSVFPAARAHGGMANGRLGPHVLRTHDGPLAECPMSVVHMLGRRVSLFGGGYLRLAPKWLIRRGIAQLRATAQPMIVYAHPREIDPDHPRLPLGLRRRFKCYVNLRTTMGKLEWLCREHDFRTLDELAAGALASEQADRTVYPNAA